MSTIHENSSFKLKAGVVETDAGLVPEKGAMVFDESLNALVVGDGFNWIALGGTAPVKDAVALNLATPVIQALVAATPVAPLTFFDTVVYQIGTDMVPTIGDTVTYGASYTVDNSSDWTFVSDTPQVQLTLETLIDGVPIASRIINLLAAGLAVQTSYLSSIAVTAGEVLTLRLTASKSCNITISTSHLGSHEV